MYKKFIVFPSFPHVKPSLKYIAASPQSYIEDHVNTDGIPVQLSNMRNGHKGRLK